METKAKTPPISKLRLLFVTADLTRHLYNLKEDLQQKHKSTLSYYSEQLSSIEYCIELLSDVTHFPRELLIITLELIKLYCKLQEYSHLFSKGIETYIGSHLYQQYQTRKITEQNETKLKKSGHKIPPLSSFTFNPEYQKQKEICDKKINDLNLQIGGVFKIGIWVKLKIMVRLLMRNPSLFSEVIYMVRPLVYIVMIWWYARRKGGSGSGRGFSVGEKYMQFLPYAVSFAMEIIALLLMASRKGKFSCEEKLEFRNRVFAFWKYVLRDPVYEAYSKPFIDFTAGKLSFFGKFFRMVSESCIVYYRCYTYLL